MTFVPMGQLCAHPSDPRKPPDWFFSRLGPHWVLKCGYPKLSLCRLYYRRCQVTSGARRPRELKMMSTCTEYRDIPWAQRPQVYVEPCSLHAYSWLYQKQAILNGGMSSKGGSHPLVLNLVLSHCSHERLTVSFCS